MKKDIAISVQGVSKSFVLPHEKTTSIKSGVVGLFRSKGKATTQSVLKNISFEVKKGEFFGIVGRNGSGKSTLLKIISQIYVPDEGRVQVNGKLTPFIELGVGFNPELSGKENVYLNGALLGFNRDEITAMYKDIVEFAELEKFMDQKLKNYSSGMQVRLAFSIAIRADSDILVLDEVLAVGDEAFQRKCFEYFATLKKRKKTVILVTHDMDSVLRFCTRAVLIDKGHKTEIGTPLKIAQIYKELNNESGITVNKTKEQERKVVGTKYVNATVSCVRAGGKVTFDIKLDPKNEMTDPIVAMGIYRDSGEQVFHWASDEKKPNVLDLNTKSNLKIELEDIFPVGTFYASLFVRKRDRTMNYAVFNEAAKFEVVNMSQYKYAVQWKVPERNYINGTEVGNV